MHQIPTIDSLRNILVCRGEGSLGDAVVSSCCYRGIKQANPACKITVVAFGAGYEFLKKNPYIDELIKLPVRTLIRPNQRWASLLWAACKLRSRKFDLVLDSSNKAYANWRLFKWVVGGTRVLDCFTSPVRPFGAPDQHGSTHEQAILKLLGIASPDKSYDLPIAPEDREHVQTWLAEHGVNRFILLNPSGSAKTRRFSKETLAQLCQALARFGCPLIVPCAPATHAYWQGVFADIPAASSVFVKQTRSVFELFEWVRRAELVVTPDTAVVHIAAGFKKPSLVFYNKFSVYNAPDNPRALIIKTDRHDVNKFDPAELGPRLDELQSQLTRPAEKLRGTL